MKSCSNPGSSRTPSKPTRTILDFFKPSTSKAVDGNVDSLPVVSCAALVKKLSCPGCNQLVSEARLDWHLDQDCTSKILSKKKKKKRNSTNKRKSTVGVGNVSKISTKNYSNHKSSILSDSDGDVEDFNIGESPILFDMPEEYYHGTESSAVYISPFMVETQLVEDSSSKTSTPNKIEVETATDDSKSNLLKDWADDSNSLPTSNKTEKPPLYSSDENCSGNESLKEKADIESNVRLSSINRQNIVLSSSCSSIQSAKSTSTFPLDKKLHNSHSSSDSEDFMVQSQNLRTSEKNLRMKSKTDGADKLVPSNQNLKLGSNSLQDDASTGIHKGNEVPGSSSHVYLNNGPSSNSTKKVVRRTFSLTSNQPTDSKWCSSLVGSHLGTNDQNNDDFDILTEELELSDIDDDINEEDDEDSSALYSPLKSPGLVTPERTPSPSPCKKLLVCPSSALPSKPCPSPGGVQSSASNSSHRNSIAKNSSLTVNAFNELLQSPSKLKVRSDSVTVSPSLSGIEALQREKIKLSPCVAYNKSRFGLSQKSPKKSSCKQSPLQASNMKAYNKSPGKTRKNLFKSQSPAKSSDSLTNEDKILSDMNDSFSSKCCDLPEILGISEQNLSQLPTTPKKSFSNSPTKSPEKNKDPRNFREHTGYYLENFQTILDSVISCPPDYKLFNDEEKDLLSSFSTFSLAAKKLFVRLFQRKVKWNRVAKIQYQDICDSEDTILYVKELSYANYLLIEDELDSPEEALSLLAGEEIIALAKLMKVNTSGKSKNDLARFMLQNCKTQPTIAAAFSGIAQPSCSTKLLLQRAKEVLGPCCLLSDVVRRVLLRVLTLYSLPRYDEDDDSGQNNQLVTLLRVNLGQVKYPSNTVRIRHADIFSSRDDLIQFEECQELYSAVKEHLENRDWQEAVNVTTRACELYERLRQQPHILEHDAKLPRFLRRYTSLSLLVLIKVHRVEALQRLKKYSDAVKTLRELLDQHTHHQDRRGGWYDRLALNLDQHLKMHSQALEVVYKALRDPEVRVGHRLTLSSRGQKLITSFSRRQIKTSKKRKINDENVDNNEHQRQANDNESQFSVPSDIKFMEPREAPRVVIEGRSFEMDHKSGFRRVFIRGDSAVHAGQGDVVACSVEELALGHYAERGYPQGLHAEGSTVNSLFGLLFWHIIYESEVPDAMRLVHQAVPLDLDYPNFYLARKISIDERVREVAGMTDGDVADAVSRVWSQHHGEISIVNWDLFKSEQHATDLILSLGVSVVSLICDRLARDHRFTRSGFPDLVVWNPSTKESRIVEVKGPNDRLSTKQILWLDYLLQAGAVAEVCHVNAIGAKMMQTKGFRVLSPSKKKPSRDEASSAPRHRDKNLSRASKRTTSPHNSSSEDFEQFENLSKRKK
ncbi:fanconi-associated nuclease 1-like [Hyalella azteca]|uniref:Fanconi-associated nuclease n=1 Tax=Hyalella azteca TaxID=294128 RepID=A0A8B7P6V4_HYAAZ|nr:fanconi-associated nuclease 1-like [Hyalella azteca]